jgi:hypothetical protein
VTVTGGPPPSEAAAIPGAGAPPRRTRRTVVLFLVAAVVLVLVPVVVTRLVDQPEGIDLVIDIPAGTARRVAAGEDVALLPADLRLGLRDRLVVVNHDDRTHRVGPMTVGPGERVARRFAEAVSLSGYCSLHTSDRIDIEVASRR